MQSPIFFSFSWVHSSFRYQRSGIWLGKDSLNVLFLRELRSSLCTTQRRNHLTDQASGTMEWYRQQNQYSSPWNLQNTKHAIIRIVDSSSQKIMSLSWEDNWDRRSKCCCASVSEHPGEIASTCMSAYNIFRATKRHILASQRRPHISRYLHSCLLEEGGLDRLGHFETHQVAKTTSS